MEPTANSELDNVRSLAQELEETVAALRVQEHELEVDLYFKEGALFEANWYNKFKWSYETYPEHVFYGDPLDKTTKKQTEEFDKVNDKLRDAISERLDREWPGLGDILQVGWRTTISDIRKCPLDLIGKIHFGKWERKTIDELFEEASQQASEQINSLEKEVDRCTAARTINKGAMEETTETLGDKKEGELVVMPVGNPPVGGISYIIGKDGKWRCP